MRIFLRDKRGATAIEYGLIAGGIALAIFSTVFLFGDALVIVYDDLGASLLNRRS